MDQLRKARLSAEIAKEAATLPVSKLVKRRFLNAKARQAQKPLTGVYYWIPLPEGNNYRWEIMEFYDKDYGGHSGDVEHAQVWPEVVGMLSLKWHRDLNPLQRRLEDSLYGLPRGRINLMANNRYGIAHGGDSPVSDWESTVKRTFNLQNANAVAYIDAHEKTLPGQPQEVMTALGVNKLQNLKKTASQD